MLHIRRMNAADVPLGMRLKTQAGWNQTEADWRRFLAMQPVGCFVAELDGRPVGTAVGCTFGPVAWIAMVLVDDLMEPFRPIVDREVYRLVRDGVMELKREAKEALARTLVIDLATERGMTPLMTVIERLCQSLAAIYGGAEEDLALPRPALPLESRMRRRADGGDYEEG